MQAPVHPRRAAWGAVLSVLLLACGPATAASGPPQAAPLPLKLFARLPQSRHVRISPDGSRFAALSTALGRPAVMVRKLPVGDEKPVLLPPMEGRFEYYDLNWVGSDRLLVHSIAADEGGLDGVLFYGRFRASRLLSFQPSTGDLFNPILPIREADTGSRIAKVHEQAQVQDNVIDHGDGNSPYFLVSLDDDPARSSGESVRRVDVRDGSFTHVQGSVRRVVEWIVDRSGTVRGGRLGSGQDEIRGGMVWLDPDGDGSWKEIEGPIFADVETEFLAFDADPRFALVIAPVDGRRTLVRWSLRDNRLASVVLSDPASEVATAITADADERDIIGARLDDGRAVFLDPDWARRDRMLAAALPGMSIGYESFSRDRQQAIIVARSSTEPGTYYWFDARRKHLEPVAYAYAGIEPQQLAPAREASYPARDGLAISAVLTLPRGASGPLAAVVLPHGGPWAHDDARHFDWLAQFLASRGYAVLQPDYRGSTGHGRAFERAGDRQWGRAMQDDIEDGARWLVAQGYADPARICIAGASWGGYAALLASVRGTHPWRCAASLNGISDLVAMLTTDNRGLKNEASAKLIGDPARDAGELRATSPIHGAARANMPVLLVHARDDMRVDVAQSVRMHDALKGKGKDSTLVLLDHGDHSLLDEASRTRFLEELERFLARNLAAGPVPAAAP